MAILVPSILSADFTKLGAEVAAAASAGADRIQVDVMDGHFVPNISIGSLGVAAVRRATNLPIEAHLMITDPARYVDDFLRAGADIIIIHWETVEDPHELLAYIRKNGKKAGLAISPDTPVAAFSDLLLAADMFLVMTVHPGFGGQELIPETLGKVTKLRSMLNANAVLADIEVDGGISALTAPVAIAAGANVLVAGSAVYSHPDGAAAGMKHLRAACG